MKKETERKNKIIIICLMVIALAALIVMLCCLPQKNANVSFPIQYKLTNVAMIGGNAEELKGGEIMILMFQAEDGYSLPENVNIVGASYRWNKSTGMLEMGNPTENICVTITAQPLSSAE